MLDFAGVNTVVSAIDRILSSSETPDTDECESALEALGQIGSCKYALLLGNRFHSVKHIYVYY